MTISAHMMYGVNYVLSLGGHEHLGGVVMGVDR